MTENALLQGRDVDGGPLLSSYRPLPVGARPSFNLFALQGTAFLLPVATFKIGASCCSTCILFSMQIPKLLQLATGHCGLKNMLKPPSQPSLLELVSSVPLESAISVC